METLPSKLEKRGQLRLEDLREFTRQTFGWDYRIGAIKFIRVLAPALLVRSMLYGQAEDNGTIQRIANQRNHFSADGEPELRLGFIPADVVPIDLSQEADEIIPSSREGLALNSDDEFDVPADDDAVNGSQPTKVHDVTKIDSAWILEDVVRQTAPGTFSEWEEAQRAKAVRKSPAKRKGTTTKAAKAAKAAETQRGSMDKFVKVTKTSTILKETQKGTMAIVEKSKEMKKVAPSNLTQPSSPPPHSSPRESSKQPTPSGTKDSDQPTADIWTSARSQMTPTRSLGPAGAQEAILISSSPPNGASPPPSPSPRPRAPPASSQEVFGVIRSGFTSRRGSKGVKSKTTAPKGVGSSQDSPSTLRYKQTSMDMFTTRTDSLTSSQPALSINRPASPVYFDKDEDDDLPTISSLISKEPPEPKSPSKRNKSPPESDRAAIPVKAAKKKLFVPNTSAVGFFTEIEVDADERDEMISRESRRLENKGDKRGVVRWSDVSFVDLTQDD